MNYYKRHIGDYAAATRHLSILEHGVYTLMLDMYYTSEQGLPKDLSDVCRKLNARSKDERAAVEVVLKDFFVPTGAGWVQSRCDAEIAAFQAKAESNKVVGGLGGRPKKKTQAVNSENPEITQMVSGFDGDGTLTTNHKPLTINQEPVIHTPLVHQQGDACVSLPGQVCLAMKAKAGVADVNPGHPTLLMLLDAGATLAEFEGAAVAAVSKSKGFAYALGTVKRTRQEAARDASSVHSGPLPAASFETPYQRAAREKMTAWAPGIAAKSPDFSNAIETVEASNVIAIERH